MRVLFLDSVHECVADNFVNLGWTVDFHFQTPLEELLHLLPLYDGLILRSRLPIDKNFLIHAPHLQFIGRPGAGLENIDLDYCKQHGIEVFRSPEGNRDAVAEHALGMLLMLLNNLKRADLEVRQGIWKREENRGYELMGKTFGIIGYGFMGRAIAQRLKGFGVTVLAYDKYIKNFGTENVQEVSLEELQKRSDIISLHLPQSPETIGYVNDSFIASCKKPFYLINTARGKSVNTEAVLKALDQGRILGACLDVLEFESASFETTAIQNSTFQKLANHDQVVLSPHIAGWTHEAQFKMGDYLSKKIIHHFTKNH